RDARRAAAKIPPPAPKPEVVPAPEGFLESLWRFLTKEHPAIGGAVAVGFIIFFVFIWNLSASSRSITSGPAVVDNAPQLNLRSCPAANCGLVVKLNK